MPFIETSALENKNICNIKMFINFLENIFDILGLNLKKRLENESQKPQVNTEN